MKTKIIKSHYSSSFEHELNDFLNRQEVNKVISINYSTMYKENSIYPETYTALVLYK